MKTTVNGKDIIRHAEGLRLEAYLCQANVPTIGYGHTQGVKLGDRCTRVQAEVWLSEDIAASEKFINNLGLRLSQNQFDALVSFVYNIGETKLRGTRTLSMIVSNPNNPEIGAQLKKWVNAGGKKSNGLVIRRDREVKLYFTK